MGHGVQIFTKFVTIAAISSEIRLNILTKLRNSKKIDLNRDTACMSAMATQSTKLRAEYDEEGDRSTTTNRRALGKDALNRKIIAMLQQDGRMPFSKIAEELGTSEGTVRYRVNQMTEAKVLKIIGVADPIAMGNEGYALIALKLGSSADPREVSRRFETCDEVTYILFAAGQYDLVVEVICETHRNLREFLLEHCYGQADIASVEPMLALALYKNLMKWGRP